MSFGATFYNSSGFVQVNEQNKNFEVLQTGNISIPIYVGTRPIMQPSGGLASAEVSIRGFSIPPLLFVKFESYDSFIGLNYISSSYLGIQLYGNANARSWSIPYMLAQPIASAAPTGFGIKVISDNGTITFATDKKYVRIFSAISLANGPNTPAPNPAIGYGNFYNVPGTQTGAFSSSFTTPWVCINGILGVEGYNYWVDSSDPYGNGQTYTWNDTMAMGVRTNSAGIIQTCCCVKTPGGPSGGGGDLDSGTINSFYPTFSSNSPPFILAS